MIVGGVLWFVWTYMGMGAMYFPNLDPVYLTIGYWHFAFSAAAAIFVVKVFQKEDRKNVTNNTFG